METPIKEIKTGNFDPREYELIRMGLTETEGNENVIKSLDHVRNALDLGSGQGNSAIGITTLAPNVQEIETVDIAMSIWPWVIDDLKPIKIHHHRMRINNFLKRNTAKFDLINLGSVPNHNIKTDADYANLANACQTNGLVVESGETHLSNQQMQTDFNEVYYAPWNFFPHRTRIWKKK